MELQKHRMEMYSQEMSALSTRMGRKKDNPAGYVKIGGRAVRKGRKGFPTMGKAGKNDNNSQENEILTFWMFLKLRRQNI